MRDFNIKLTNQMLGNKHTFIECYLCEVMHAMSTSSPSIEYYEHFALLVY